MLMANNKGWSFASYSGLCIMCHSLITPFLERRFLVAQVSGLRSTGAVGGGLGGWLLWGGMVSAGWLNVKAAAADFQIVASGAVLLAIAAQLHLSRPSHKAALAQVRQLECRWLPQGNAQPSEGVWVALFAAVFFADAKLYHLLSCNVFCFRAPDLPGKGESENGHGVPFWGGWFLLMPVE